MFAQQRLGLAQSNYSPTSTFLQNPSSLVDSKVFCDFFIGGADFFIYNNYAYLPAKDFSFTNLLLKGQYPEYSVVSSKEEYQLYTAYEFQSFSTTIQNKEHGFGISSRYRAFGSIKNMPKFIIEFSGVDPDRPPSFTLSDLNKDKNVKNITAAAIAYDEFAFSYANAIKHFDRDLITVGGTVKYLLGVTGGGLSIDNLDYRLDTSGVLKYSNLNATSEFVPFPTTASFSDIFKGSGFAFDFGITFKKMLYNVTHYDPFGRVGRRNLYDYKWKLGLSIVDMGYIAFKNSQYSSISGASGDLSDPNSFSSIEAPSDILTQLGNGADMDEKTEFSMSIPTTFIMQYDYNFENKIHLSVQYNLGLPKKGIAVQSPSIFAITPRFEARRFELSFPISMFNYQEVRTGVMIRIGGIAMGTDKLGTFLSITNATGYDFYLQACWKFYDKKRNNKSSLRNKRRMR